MINFLSFGLSEYSLIFLILNIVKSRGTHNLLIKYNNSIFISLQQQLITAINKRHLMGNGHVNGTF